MSFEWTVFSVFIVVLHMCGAGAAAHAIMTVRNSQSAVAWAISLALIPYFTLFPYLLFGRSRLSPHPSLPVKPDRFPIQSIDDQSSRDGSDSALQGELSRFHALAGLSGSPVLPKNSVRLLVNGIETFNVFFAALAHAQHTIYLQCFTVHHDVLGKQLRDLLCERALAGVRVYFLYDRVGSHKLPRTYIRILQAHGVHTQAFSAGKYWRNPLRINFRNHRKLAIIDHQIAFLGGLNIGTTYLDAHPRLSPWRDTHLQVKGKVVGALITSFVQDWFWMTNSLPKDFVDYVQFNVGGGEIQPERQNHDVIKAKENGGDVSSVQYRAVVTNVLCQALATGPSDAKETCLLFFVAAINSASKRIWLASPYFIPDDAIRVALQLAVLRGVDVRLLLPGLADHRTVYAASSLYAYDILRAGVKVYRYQPGFMHQKVVLIDDAMAAIGSANLDNRSFRLNFELTLMVFDTIFAKLVEAMLEQDFAQSSLISAAEYQQAPIWKKFAMHVAKLFSPIL